MAKIDFTVGIGGAAGQGIATPGDILALIFARRGLHVNAYNADVASPVDVQEFWAKHSELPGFALGT